MGGNGGCGCGAVGAEPCRCEGPVAPPGGVPPPDAMPAEPAAPRDFPPAPVAAPGTPHPYTRFDLFEESRRRGFPVAFPDDPSRPPPPLDRGEAERLRSLAEAGTVVLEPPPHPEAAGRPVLEPGFDPPKLRAAADVPLAPSGAPLDMERFHDVASPDGVVVPFDLAWPGDLPQQAEQKRRGGMAAWCQPIRSHPHGRGAAATPSSLRSTLA